MGDLVVSIDMARAERVDESITHLLDGGSPAADDLSRDLSVLTSVMDEAFPPVEISPEVESAHMEILLPAAAALQDAPAMPEKRGSMRRRLAEVFAPLSRRVAAGVFAVTTAFSGMAVAGALPAPLQRTAADIGNFVGLDLPDPSRGAPPIKVDRAPDTEGGSISVPPSEAEQNEPDAENGSGTSDQESGSQGPREDEQGSDEQGSSGEQQEDNGEDEQGEAEEHLPGDIDEVPDDLGDRQDDDHSVDGDGTDKAKDVGEDKVGDDDRAGDADAPADDARVESDDTEDAPEDERPDSDDAEDLDES
jgi:hypothetical protein